jgi:hypothetical protein
MGGYSQYFPVDTAELNSACRELEKNPGSVEQSKIFFDAFPATWMEFMMTYQYVPNDDYDNSLLIKWLDRHIQIFTKISSVIPDSIYCDRLISLSVSGRWDGDISVTIQNILHKIMSVKPETIFRRLPKQTRGFQLRFWQFYWSSLEANNIYDKECDNLKRKMINKFPNEVKIMTTAFEYAWKEMMYPVDFVRKKQKKKTY